MPKLTNKGFAHILLIFILLAGIITGVYLVQHPQIFKPKAYNKGQVQTYENDRVSVIDNLKRSFPNDTTNNIFVYLEVKPPSWEIQSSENHQYTTLLRVSLDQDKMEKDSDCEITGDPETNCREIVLDNPNDKLYLSWVLPEKSEDYHIYVRFFSNANNTKDSSAPITYKDSSEVGFEVPAIFIGIQSFLSTIFDAFRKTPGAAAFNAAAVFISQVHTAGEQIITLSHAQQLGFNVDLTTSEDGEIEFLYDQDQLSRLDISLEFFPDPDPVTGEPRLQINPKANPSEQTEFAQGTLEIALGELGGRLAGHLINTGVSRVAESKAIQTIKSKVKISSTENEVPLSPVGTRAREVQRGVGRVAGLRVRNVAKMNRYEQGWFKDIWPLLRTGEAYVLDPDISRPILNRLITGVESAYGDLGLPNLNRKAIMETINNNWVVVIPDYHMSRIYNREHEAAALAANRLVIISERYADDVLILAHEFVHVISANNRKLFGISRVKPIGVYFKYDQDQAEIYGATMSQIYELFTDKVVNVLFGSGTVYKKAYPELNDSLTAFIDALIRESGGGVTSADFSIFALTGNDKTLMKTLLDHGINPDRFMSILNREIDGRKLALIMRDYRAKNNSWLAPVGLGGGAVFLGAFFAAEAHGEELPEDISIVYEPLDQDIDLTVTISQPE